MNTTTQKAVAEMGTSELLKVATARPWRTAHTHPSEAQGGDWVSSFYSGKEVDSKCVGDFVQARPRSYTEADANAELIRRMAASFEALREALSNSNAVLACFAQNRVPSRNDPCWDQAGLALTAGYNALVLSEAAPTR